MSPLGQAPASIIYTQIRVRDFSWRAPDASPVAQHPDGGGGEAFEAFENTGGALPHDKLSGRDGKLIETFGAGNAEDPLSPSDIDKAIATALKG